MDSSRLFAGRGGPRRPGVLVSVAVVLLSAVVTAGVQRSREVRRDRAGLDVLRDL